MVDHALISFSSQANQRKGELINTLFWQCVNLKNLFLSIGRSLTCLSPNVLSTARAPRHPKASGCGITETPLRRTRI